MERFVLAMGKIIGATHLDTIIFFHICVHKYQESFETWCWRRMEKISWTDHVRNEDVLLRVNEQRNILHEIRKRKANWMVTSYVETAFYNRLSKER